MNTNSLSLLEEELEELRAKDLYRELRTLETKSGAGVNVDGARAKLDGREVILFCGNDYLGLSRHPRVIAAAKKAADRYGIGSGAARLISGTSPLHRQLEETLARWKKKERALLFTTGYLANLGILTAFARAGDLIVMDKYCHASLVDGARLSGAAVRVFPHKNYSRCREILEKSSGFRRRLLVTDTVFSMDGDLADLGELVRIKEKFGCLLVADDAHGTGVLGLEGRGGAEDSGLECKIDIVMGTLSKALGSLGGFAAASGTLIEYLINFSRPFIFATSLPPLLCAAALESLAVLKEEPEIRRRLWRNIQKIQEGLAASGFETGPIQSPIFPIMIGEAGAALEASRSLLKEGILVPAVRYPTVPKGKARLRLTISAVHREEDIKALFKAFPVIKKGAFDRQVVA